MPFSPIFPLLFVILFCALVAFCFDKLACHAKSALLSHFISGSFYIILGTELKVLQHFLQRKMREGEEQQQHAYIEYQLEMFSVIATISKDEENMRFDIFFSFFFHSTFFYLLRPLIVNRGSCLILSNNY